MRNCPDLEVYETPVGNAPKRNVAVWPKSALLSTDRPSEIERLLKPFGTRNEPVMPVASKRLRRKSAGSDVEDTGPEPPVARTR